VQISFYLIIVCFLSVGEVVGNHFERTIVGVFRAIETLLDFVIFAVLIGYVAM
jgi:hypothetical protein